MVRRQCLLVLVVGFSLSTILGCGGSSGPDTVSAGGTVKFDDGSPLSSDGRIHFSGEKHEVKGRLQGGSFTLGTNSATDGAPAGTYRVYFSGACLNDLDPKFASAATSGVEITIDSGGNSAIEVTVTRKP